MNLSQTTLRSFSIFAQVFLLGLIVLAITLAGVFHIKKQAEEQQSYIKGVALSAQVNLMFKDELEHLISDVNYLSTFPEFVVSRFAEAQQHDALTKLFLNYALKQQRIDQVRILSPQGLEQIRINKKGQQAFATPSDQLQDKSQRYYFLDALDIQQGIAISKLDLNKEKGKIEMPIKPMIRLSKPIYIQQKLYGVLVINYKAQPLIDEIDRFAKSQKIEFMMSNPEDEWIIPPPGSGAWGKSLGVSQDLVSEKLPLLRAHLSTQGKYSGFWFEEDHQHYVMTLSPATMGIAQKIQMNRLGQLFVLTHFDKHISYWGMLKASDKQTLVFALLLLNFLIALVISGLVRHRENAQKEAEFHANMMDDFFSRSPDAIFICDAQGEIKIQNEQLQQLLQKVAEQSQSLIDDLLLTPSSRQKAITELVSSAENEVEKELEVQIAKRSYFFYLQAFAFNEPKSQQIYLAATIADTSKIKQKEVELQDTLATNKSLMESAPDAILLCDLQGKISLTNLKSQRLFEGQKTQIMGANLFQFFMGEDERQLRDRIQAMSDRPETLYAESNSLELQALTLKGHLLPVEINLSPVTLNNATFIISSVRDLSERQKLEANLRQSQKMDAIGQMAGSIAHDFNNLLAAISGNIDLAKRFLDKKPDKALVKIDQAKNATVRASLLTKKLLGFSRKSSFSPREINLSEFMAEERPLFETAVGSKVALHLEIAEANLPIKTDSVELEAAIINLIVNAKDAMKSEGQLDINLRLAQLDATQINQCLMAVPAGVYVEVVICDSGTGIPPDLLQEIFQPFFTTKPQGKGTGLGLSSVLSFIEKNQGTLKVNSSSQGSCFHLYFPQSNALYEKAAVEVADKAQAASRVAKVLVVEDEEELRILIAEALVVEDYEVYSAESVDMAEQLCQNHRYDLILSDILMPDRLGTEMIDVMKHTSNTDAELLFMSGFTGMDEQTSQLISQYPFISKPFDMRELMAVVKQILPKKDSNA